MPQDSQGRYRPPPEPSAAAAMPLLLRDASDATAGFDTTDIDSIIGVLTVTAAAGTNPTLDLECQTSADGTNFYKVAQFPQTTAAATADSQEFGPLGVSTRWRWVIGGADTPSFTFSVTASMDR